ncbi:hypothetical protein L1987_05491 [Smallanthus sonchifolius]|uniref:Uncharacterized protein n=1 Tax=Smallanthus sonchifolius TaxID=185202 RepID=A0ACB9JVX1_9ASTR|nr:hypothetical protein L1987_05491 [Smallanthus sonchifolius]
MPAVKQPEETVTGHLRLNNDRKTPTLKAFEESYGSYSEDMENYNYSPKLVVSRMMTWPAAVKDVSRRARNQIERIRAEDSHLGEDIGECLITRVCGSDDVMIFSRPASPLSGGKVNLSR